MANILRPTPLRGKEFWVGSGGLESGMLEEAAKEQMTMSMLLEEMKSKKQGEASPYLGLTFQEVWAMQHALKKAGQPVPLTAYAECLQEAGIKAFGARADKMEKYFQFSDTDVLFPEYFSNQVYAGMLKEDIVPLISMGETVIDGVNYHKIYLEDVEGDRQLGEVAPREEFGETKIIVAKQSIYLTKYGRYITVSYEDIKFQRLNIFGRALQRIGQQIAIDRSDDMIYTAINGDGNSNTPGTTIQPATTAMIGTADVIEWATGMPTPYKMNIHVGRKALLIKYYTNLADFDNPIATWGFMGIDLPRTIEWDRSVLTTDYIMGFDSRYAIEHLTTGAVLTESEKLIRKQISGTAVSHRDAFSVFDKNAIAIWDTSF